MALHRLTALRVGVTDLDAARDWYTRFGLDEVEPAHFATRDGGVQLIVEQAPHRGIRRIGLGVDDPDDLDRLAAALTSAGVAFDHDDTLRFADPVDAVPYEVSVAPRYGAEPVPVADLNTPSDVRRHDRPADAVLRAGPVRPSNLTHMVRGTVDPEASIAFHTDVLGFEVSDGLGGIGAFMRCSEVHHNLAVQLAPVPFLHHISFECDDVDEVGRGAAHMIEHDAECHVWGLGRHAIGSNYFWYLRDPSGNYAEYSSDIDRITTQDAYRPKDWNDKESLLSWGPPTPVEFIAPPDIDELIAAMQEG